MGRRGGGPRAGLRSDEHQQRAADPDRVAVAQLPATAEALAVHVRPVARQPVVDQRPRRADRSSAACARETSVSHSSAMSVAGSRPMLSDARARRPGSTMRWRRSPSTYTTNGAPRRSAAMRSASSTGETDRSDRREDGHGATLLSCRRACQCGSDRSAAPRRRRPAGTGATRRPHRARTRRGCPRSRRPRHGEALLAADDTARSGRSSPDTRRSATDQPKRSPGAAPRARPAATCRTRCCRSARTRSPAADHGHRAGLVLLPAARRRSCRRSRPRRGHRVERAAELVVGLVAARDACRPWSITSGTAAGPRRRRATAGPRRR